MTICGLSIGGEISFVRNNLQCMNGKMNTEVFLFCQRKKASYSNIMCYEVICIKNCVEGYL